MRFGENISLNGQNKQNRFVPLSEGVIASAVHPLNGTIVVRTKVCSLDDLLLCSFCYSYRSYASPLKNKKEIDSSLVNISSRRSCHVLLFLYCFPQFLFEKHCIIRAPT